MLPKPDIRYEEFPAPDALSAYVECFWALTGSSDGLLQEVLVTGGRAELIFSNTPLLWYGINRKSRPKAFTGAFVVGQRSRVNYVGLRGPLDFFGIRFRYGCMPLFLKRSAEWYSNTITPLSAMRLPPIGRDRTPGAGAVPGACSPGSVEDLRLAEEWLRGCLLEPPEEWQILQELIRQLSAEPDVTIGALAEKYDWNYKRVERVFCKYTGFPPRTFMKILRFRYAVERAAERPETYTGAAHQMGYYDQSHFIRDFRRYTSDKPSSFYRNPPAIAAFIYKLKK